ncbi:MAG: roadblock/LC7 domain-containing protein [Candidatus Hermodarchaeota archaeon]
MSYSEDEARLKKILNTIINSTPGLKYAIITDDTGITIMSQSKFAFSENDNIPVEKIGAIGGAVFIAGEEQGHILGYGNINLQITEYFEGMIFSMKVGKGVLCISTDKRVQTGFIIAMMKKWAPKITIILNRYLKEDQGELSKEIKELFGTDTVGLF